jgi:hypothetical protein
MKYKNVQFIGYNIDTAPKDAVWKEGFIISGTALGLADPKEDIKSRVALMQNAIQVAEPNADTDKSTLKVFMSPEFYFRGKKGAYTMDEVQIVISSLQETIKDAKYSDWLFVFGSIVGYSEKEESIFRKFYNIITSSQTEKEAYNIILVQKGGYGDNEADRDKGAHVVMKEFLSNMDFLLKPNSGFGFFGKDRSGIHHLGGGATGAGREQQVVNYDGLGIFESDGITFGLEVCLDHAKKRLAKSPQLPKESMIQVQLIPSCGMNIQNFSVVTVQNGLVFNVDGYGTPPQTASAALQQIIDPHTPIVVSPPSQIYKVNPDQASPPVGNVDQIFASGPGGVEIFETVVIPPEQKVPGFSTDLEFTIQGDITFKFELIYDNSRNYVTTFCTAKYLADQRYSDRFALPVAKQSHTIGDKQLAISMEARPASFRGMSQDMGLWVDFNYDGEHFEGFALPFDSKLS